MKEGNPGARKGGAGCRVAMMVRGGGGAGFRPGELNGQAKGEPGQQEEQEEEGEEQQPEETSSLDWEDRHCFPKEGFFLKRREKEEEREGSSSGEDPKTRKTKTKKEMTRLD